MFKVAIMFMVLIGHLSVHAQDGLESASQEALDKTKALLTDPSQRNKAVQETDSSRAAHEYVESLGPEHTDEIYSLASQVFEKLVLKYNGDTEKIKQVLEKAKADPSGFASSEFSGEELNALRDLASKMQPAGPSGK